MSGPTDTIDTPQPGQPDQSLIPVRVNYRQLDYITKITNVFDQEIDGIKTAYGPGMPQNDPAQLDLEPESQAYADKLSDYQKGELILLRRRQFEGLMASGAVRVVQMDEDGFEVDESDDEEILDIDSASVDQLADWIKNENPTVNDVVQASDGNADLARKLLEAERIAKEEPRKGVYEGLSAVIARG